MYTQDFITAIFMMTPESKIADAHLSSEKILIGALFNHRMIDGRSLIHFRKIPMIITLTPYNKNWVKEFEIEKEKLEHFLNDIVVAIEHIGSTAIPEIYAKPVIDILIGVYDLEKVNDEYIHQIESLGYHYIQVYEKELPYRRFFLKNDSKQNRTHHIHLVNYYSAWWQRHILFRDYLRNNPNEARKYETLKLKLAETMNASLDENETKKRFYNHHIRPYPELIKEYKKLNQSLGENFTLGNHYALAKSQFIQSINLKAYFDFEVHQPTIVLNHLNGYIPQQICFEVYKKMFQDPDFIKCFGVRLTEESIHQILERETCHWDKYGYGSYCWFEKANQKFVGKGGLNHTIVDGREEIELTYSISKSYWGHGFAVEIGRFAIDYGFNTLRLSNIVCFTMTTNHQSLRVIEKLGFNYEKEFIYKTLPHKLFRLKNEMLI